MTEPEQKTTLRQGLGAVPRTVLALGVVSMFMDTSSELVHSLLPVFLVTTLGASALSVGLIEGITEATANITKVFSGALSDYFGRRKGLTVIGYSLAAASKPLFPLADTVAWAFTARFIDRIGKGIRGAPRDALIADITPEHARGAAYGLRQSLDTVGAVAGPLLAIAFMVLLEDDIRAVLWVAVVPAMFAVAVLVYGVREPPTSASAPKERRPIRAAHLRRLGTDYWWLLAITAVLTLARFSEAFLILRAGDVGLSIAFVPVVMVVMNVVYALSAYPAGRLSDTVDRRGLLAGGVALLIASDVVLALAPDFRVVMAGVVLWGLHMGLTQGIFAAMVADMAPEALRGTAFGIYNLAGGAALLLASALAGWLWDTHGPAATFIAGAAFAALALLGLVLAWRLLAPRPAT